MQDFKIDKLEIEGFRGYNRLQTLDFNSKSVLLTGGNYCGKSSTLGAIEWCLFGDFTSVPDNVSLSRKRDEFINDRCKEINVNLHLSENGKKIKVTRSKKRNVMKTDFIVTDTDGNVFNEMDAEKKLFQLLGLTLDDFIRSVYLHQESIRFLLTEDPLARNTALDRLLGLERLTRILENIPLNKIKKEIVSFSGAIEEIKKNLEFRLRENKISLNEVKNKARDAGISTEDLSLKYAIIVSDDIHRSLSEMIKDENLQISEHETIISLEDLKKVRKAFEQLVENIREKIFENEEIEGLNQEKRNLTDLLNEYTDELKDFLNEKKSLDIFEKDNGNEKKINLQLKKTQEKIQELEELKEKSGSKQKLLQDSLRFFEDFTVKECPVCNSKVNQKSVVQKLRLESEKYISKELKKLDEQQEKLRQDEMKYAGLLYSLSKVERSYNKAKKIINEVIENIQNKLDEKVNVKSDIKALISKKLDIINKKNEKLTRPLKKKDNILRQNESKIHKLDLLEDYLSKKERQKKLEQIQQRNELQKAEAVILELSGFHDMLTTIIKCIQEVQVEAASKLIKKASSQINEIYNELVKHPYYTKLDIEVIPSLKRGTAKNNYFIKGINISEGVETLVAERFSTGHMNCVALAIYLALSDSGSLNHNLNFLILDDPSQNLDKRHMQSLAKILKRISKRSQLIISTQDPAFTPIIYENLKEEPTIKIDFGEWNQKTGPSLACTK